MPGTAVVDFKNMISGDGAFYKQPDYKQQTVADLQSLRSLKPSYIVQYESRVLRIAKFILSLVIFPIFIYNTFRNLLARVLIYPATFKPVQAKISQAALATFDPEGERKYKRFTVEVDGQIVDACLIGKESTLENGRFVLRTFGNNENYKIQDPDFDAYCDEVNANAILMDIPGVNLSTGFSRPGIQKAYQAMLKVIGSKKGFNANTIIGHGFSIGGVVQADGIHGHPLKGRIKHVFVKDRTLSSIATYSGGFMLALVAKGLMWNQSALDSSRNLKAKEIIIQTANVTEDQVIEDPKLILDDRKIKAYVSLGKPLLEDGKNYPDKVFIGTPKMHYAGFINPKFLGAQVNKLLEK
jgi:hypothetical protein